MGIMHILYNKPHTFSMSESTAVLRFLNRAPKATIAARETVERKFLQSFSKPRTTGWMFPATVLGDSSAKATITSIALTFSFLKVFRTV